VRFIVTTRPREELAPVVAPPVRFGIPYRRQRILDFDIENRPLSYLGSDFTTSEVTAIAWAWTDQPDDVTVYLLGEHELAFILTQFVAAWTAADLVCGHYCRAHDIPMIQGALVELKMPPLPDRLVQDTKIDFIKTKGISLSQESLAAMWRLTQQKQSMNQGQWRAANRLTPEGLAEVRRRVVGDVQQHLELRREAVGLGYLSPPKLWRSGSSRLEEYHP
jgi:hypothetical protein